MFQRSYVFTNTFVYVKPEIMFCRYWYSKAYDNWEPGKLYVQKNSSLIGRIISSVSVSSNSIAAEPE